MQLTRVFTSLADTYGHILRTNLAEVDLHDVVLNRRILVVLLPALEKSPAELANLGKIIIANFNNNSGLKQIGNSTFTSTAASGDPELGEAAEDGFGNILSGSLERSNVDITEELVNLITAQRNYQAAAKAMETTTSMTQTIINIRL